MSINDSIRSNSYYLIFIFFTLCWGCNKHQVSSHKAPANLIKNETMISILTDMHLLEGADALKLPIAKNISSSQEKIFIKYGTNRESFVSSLSYYKNHMDELQEIYDKVAEELATIQATIASK